MSLVWFKLLGLSRYTRAAGVRVLDTLLGLGCWGWAAGVELLSLGCWGWDAGDRLLGLGCWAWAAGAGLLGLGYWG